MPDAENAVDLHFPLAGIDLSAPYMQQPIRNVFADRYSRSTPGGLNVRGFEPATQRARGGQRAGLRRWIATPVVANWIIQELSVVVGTGFRPPGGNMQLSQSGRVVTVVAVSQGNVFVANPGDTVWTPALNGTPDTPPLAFTGILQSAANNQRLWFADGVNWCSYDPSTNSVLPWEASAGTLPADSANNAPRLICTWRGRIVLSGLIFDPQNIFFSRVGDPTDFDYSPLSVDPTQAIALDLASAGLVGDVVTTLIPYSDDVLVVGCDHHIYLLHGDPMAGGQVDRVTDVIGMAWGMPWCKDPYGNIYFVSNRMGIYTLTPGQQPQRISQSIEQLVLSVDTGLNGIRLIWDDRFQGLHVFVTPLQQPQTSYHLFYEQRSGAWWIDLFADPLFDPLCCVTLDGNDPDDRVPLIGSWDGYVRVIDPAATLDDGLAIDSGVILGPILTQDMDDMLLKDVMGVLGEGSSAVDYEVLVGRTPEAALLSEPVLASQWLAGRNPNSMIRRAGNAVFVRIRATQPWSLESVRARVATQGKVRRRGKN